MPRNVKLLLYASAENLTGYRVCSDWNLDCIESLTNIDYAKDGLKLEESRDYIMADIQRLRPQYLIMPKSIYETEKKFIDERKGSTKIIPIYQINAGTVNRLIAKKYPICDMNKQNESVVNWYHHLEKNGISGKTKENYRAVFSYLDRCLALVD